MSHWIVKLSKDGDATALLGPCGSAASLSSERKFSVCPAGISPGATCDWWLLSFHCGPQEGSGFTLALIQLLQPLLMCHVLHLLLSIVAFHWTHSSLPISFSYWEAQSWTNHPRCALMRAEYRGTTTFLGLRADPLNAEPHNVCWHFHYVL